MCYKVLEFLSALKANNNREWFENQRNTYETVRSDLTAFTRELLAGIAIFDPEAAQNDPRKCMFRINRDLRFSPDKSPYKTYMSVFMAPGGRKSGNAGYYLHLEPESSFIAAGVYAPSAEVLKAIGYEIHDDAEKFISIVQQPVFRKTFGQLLDEKLKRPPRGFPPEFPHIEWLKYKHYVVDHPLADHKTKDADLLHYIIAVFEKANPFVRYLNAAIAGRENQDNRKLIF